ncbi:MAG: DUF4131 domain-containing protein, partial [Bacteroidales bacterium]|nr:DUF4131 domain-containing protein [Bacteroidales bacterium]
MPNQFKYPFLRLLVPFILGIILGFYPILSYSNYLNVIVIVLFLFVCWLVFRWTKSYKFRWVFGMVMSLFMIFFGIARVNILNENIQKSVAFSEISNNGVIEARLIEPPNQKKMTTGFVAEITGIQGIKQTSREKVLVYLQNYPDMPNLEYGSFILFSKQPEEIAGPLNPEQFNYKAYLSLKAISYQVFLKKGEWEHLPGRKTNIIFK